MSILRQILRPPVRPIRQIHTSLVTTFAVMLQRPSDWISVPELVDLTGVHRVTIYRRFSNLVSMDVLSAKRLHDQKHFKLNPHWREVKLGVELHRRAVASGLI